MEDELDPWLIDIKNIKLDSFTQPDGRPLDSRYPFSVDENFSSGIYCYGPKLRTHAYGEVSLALDMQRALVVEIDRIALDLAPENLPNDIPLMKDLVLVSGLRHRHLPEILASGVADELPFVVRPFRLGLTLADVMHRHRPDEDLAYGICYVAASVLAFLEANSPFEGACAMGGLTAENLYLGFDGQISVLGLGYKSLKPPAALAADADLDALHELARQFEIEGKNPVSALLQSARSLGEAVVLIRKTNPEACAGVQLRLSAMFRREFSEVLQKDRSIFGLQTLQ